MTTLMIEDTRLSTSRPRKGLEVHAVGDEERLALRRRIGEEAYQKLSTWMP